MSDQKRRLTAADDLGSPALRIGGRPLTKPAYKLRLEGLREAEGHIKANTLVRALGALLGTAERATRLAATGRSVAKGRKPAWLKAAMDFTVTGLGTGSTTVDIRAPRLGDVLHEDFAQQDFWLQQPNLQDTALDLGARAIAEAQNSRASGDHYDTSVLKEILGLGRAAETSSVRYELRPANPARTGFVFKATACAQIEERLNLIPVPRAFVISGRLDEIGHGMGRFRLLMANRRSLQGRLDRTHLDVELLRPLWGKLATVQGMVFFKPNGQPRLLEARRISPRSEGDEIFESLPQADVIGQEASIEGTYVKAMRHVDPMVIWGTWPGDEPIEELLARPD